ncbi:MAG: UV DNA damage repair endonuclease UvsE [Spirochaetaceae bacterium]|nr:UV DNA damage repair endonuclease UvsE [Spirochaetaceae bacterium]
MSIGYACIHLGSNNTKLSTLYLKNFSKEKFLLIIDNNLNALEQIINYNVKNDIKVFRISSDIIPLASHPINDILWYEIYEERLKTLGTLIKENNIRVSMHPGQYTVINSIHDSVVEKSIEDLRYHARFLDALTCDYSSKIVLHIGGVYNDKNLSMERFIGNYNTLDQSIKNRLIIENDDKSYNIEDVLSIFKVTNIPVVFDNLHHELNPPLDNNLSQFEWIEICNKTWKEIDGKQKIHYSQSANNYKNGAHSQYIKASTFLEFYNNIKNKNIDIMLEVKDKNLSAIKCNLLIMENLRVIYLEREWAKYKYHVLGNSSKTYQEIRTLLKNKSNPDVIKFYSLIESSLDSGVTKNSQVNTIQHLWGYFKKIASKSEKNRFLKLLEGYKEDKKTLSFIKNYIYKLSYKYSIEYLLDSLYFYINGN